MFQLCTDMLRHKFARLPKLDHARSCHNAVLGEVNYCFDRTHDLDMALPFILHKSKQCAVSSLFINMLRWIFGFAGMLYLHEYLVCQKQSRKFQSTVPGRTVELYQIFCQSLEYYLLSICI